MGLRERLARLESRSGGTGCLVLVVRLGEDRKPESVRFPDGRKLHGEEARRYLARHPGRVVKRLGPGLLDDP